MNIDCEQEDDNYKGILVFFSASRRTSSILQVAAVDMVPSDKCNDTLKSRRNRNWKKGLASHQICAGHTPGGIDACQVCCNCILCM